MGKVSPCQGRWTISDFAIVLPDRVPEYTFSQGGMGNIIPVTFEMVRAVRRKETADDFGFPMVTWIAEFHFVFRQPLLDPTGADPARQRRRVGGGPWRHGRLQPVWFACWRYLYPYH